jgi:outer membrane immunogenic protein
VAGIEGDIGGGSNADRVVMHPDPGIGRPGPIFRAHSSDWLASVTGRLGYTWGPGMIYAKGGVAFRDRGSFENIRLPAFTVDTDTTGYTLGAGLEYMFAPAWSAKIEYQYYNFGRTAVNDANLPIETLSYRDDIHAVKAGINYHFGSR